MRKVAVVPATVHTAGVVDAKLTGSPELAVAVRETDPPALWPATTPKLIV
jgi:hypothetical protein